ncbi:hypothetical protein M5K25_012014 [Dendrobium thyrsiflorum]|uniref:Bifunctional lysine-specific demethylase and histidyl-hydroxylase n=1 Tax=Dendrobium thyrsiflorum TaxID=117978 RepID=A0ABD0V4D4_DENTH
MGERRRRRKRMKIGDPSSALLYSSLDPSFFDLKVFPLMLAAASAADAQNPSFRSLLKHFLSAHLALITSTTRSPLPLSILLPPGLLSLLPLLLTSSCPALAVLSAQLVGAASLFSLEANLIIVLDKDIVNGLLRALVSRSRRVVVAACNAVLDLSASSIGRETLRRKFNVIEKLLSLLCQVNDSPIDFVSLLHDEKCDSPLALILDAALILINTSDEGCLQYIPHELIEKVLPLLKELWENSCNSELTNNLNMEQGRMHSKKYDLAASLFRLSMDYVLPLTWKADELVRGIFGDEQFAFENFILNYWEVSPLHIKGTWNSLEGDHSIFNSLSNCFGYMKDENFLASLLGMLVSCPPIASDELDIFSFLKEANDLLGSQIIYGQDIRILKTSKITSEAMPEIVGEEAHFFKDKLTDELSVQTFKEALQDGYTIALRGMEFRNTEVAAITEGLSNLFGQPSVGANIYLTPPKSQGLAKHYDDHCVFVWQIFGQKQWRIFPRSEAFIPRLYEPLGSLQSMSQDEVRYMDVLIKEGDVLYIPRGYPHEAHTIINMDESYEDYASGYSMHLTIGIEVEPPFDWEGFTHIAIHCWNQKQKHSSIYPIDCEMFKLRSVLVNMLHVVVRQMADKNTVFRKACLIISPFFSSNIKLKQETTFDHIIEEINKSSSFSETFDLIATAVQENNEDYLQWMRWLRHLRQERFEKLDFDRPLELFKEFVLLNDMPFKEVMAEFSQVKSDFCRSVVFEDAGDELKVLLEKYRTTREQYMKGMLSLHRTT